MNYNVRTSYGLGEEDEVFVCTSWEQVLEELSNYSVQPCSVTIAEVKPEPESFDIMEPEELLGEMLKASLANLKQTEVTTNE